MRESIVASAVEWSTEWATEGLISEPDLYLYTAVLMAVATLGFLVWTLQLSTRRRRYGVAAAYVTFVLCLAYVGMSTGTIRIESQAGQPVPATRFIAYLFSVSVILWLLTRVGEVGRFGTVGVFVAFLALLGGTISSWFLTEPLAYGSNAVSLLSLLLIAYALLGPGAQDARATTPERHLLFSKLRNLLLLAWISYLIVGLVSRQGLGLLDAFVGIFIGTYIDVLLHVGFGALLLRHGDALDQLSRGTGTESQSTDDPSTAVSVEPAGATDASE
ncbi:bacteriorhodopsin [Halobacteria archaeon AArc-curdl1]|uniref:Bacteriorhodopsin n=1 Tax=Natronosalvus hydrolyticus TaxID=2979988 RepID=A0AAP3E617_9EURY|nr:bacteriorhodopsin [Halobacteria archaeon AArc-curdl1]